MSWQSRLQQTVAHRRLDEERTQCAFSFSHRGEAFVASLSGALYAPHLGALLVADLHLEKGSAYARSGQFLPPYDSQQTLDLLAADIAAFKPQQVICLGDSFHDIDGASRMTPEVADRLSQMIKAQEWLWLTGNHDPEIADYLGGDRCETITIAATSNSIVLCHEPEGANSTDPGFEICGHLHPVARIPARGRILRRKCFVLAQSRIIMPSYGSYTGGLELCDEAFAPYISQGDKLLVIGRQTLAMHDAAISVPRRKR